MNAEFQLCSAAQVKIAVQKAERLKITVVAWGSKTLLSTCVPMDAYLNVALSCERTKAQGGLESWPSTANRSGHCTVIEHPRLVQALAGECLQLQVHHSPGLPITWSSGIRIWAKNKHQEHLMLTCSLLGHILVSGQTASFPPTSAYLGGKIQVLRHLLFLAGKWAVTRQESACAE